MTVDEISGKLVAFIQANLVGDEHDITIDENTPLLELGVLNSLKTAMLLNYIRDGLHTPIPPEKLSAKNFKSAGDIAALVHAVAA